jgi:hypothetical protein
MCSAVGKDDNAASQVTACAVAAVQTSWPTQIGSQSGQGGGGR